jgi:cell division protein FtsW (lipid II flippase)
MKLATISAIVLIALTSQAHAAGNWIYTGSQNLNPSTLGKTCYYRWSTNVNQTKTIVVPTFSLCPLNG